MNDDGAYFVHAYLYAGRWHEWSPEAHDAVEWVDLERCHDAAKAWMAIHGDSLPVVRL